MVKLSAQLLTVFALMIMFISDHTQSYLELEIFTLVKTPLSETT